MNRREFLRLRPLAAGADDDHLRSPRARIGEACLAFHQVECRVCGERCEARAIRFQLAPRSVARPQVDQARCTGCGACAADCPVRAISLAEPSMERSPA